MHVYVADTKHTLRGSSEDRHRMACIAIIGWLVLGFLLAFRKAVLGQKVVWIGSQLRITKEGELLTYVYPYVLENRCGMFVWCL